MGESPTFNAKLVAQDGLTDKELGRNYLIQVDVDKPGRVFVDISSVVFRALDRTLPNEGEYYVDQSEDWFEKHGDIEDN